MATSVVGENPVLFPISIEGKWGYIDGEGTIVIEPQFLKANRFSEGLAVVAIAGRSEEDRVFERTHEGFIGPDGTFVIPPKPPAGVQEIEGFSTYSYDDFHEGLARIHINDASGMDGFINRTGKLVILPKFDTSAHFSEGLAFAQTWRRWDDPGPKEAGFIDKQGRFVIQGDTFRFGYDFAHGRAVVSVQTDEDDWAVGVIDLRGRFLIPPGVYSSLSSPVDGALCAVKDEKIGLVDMNGRVLVPLGQYDSILDPLSGNVFTAQLDGKVVLIDAKGKRFAEVGEPGDVGRFREGMATIEREKRFGYIDAAGMTRIAAQFDEAEAFDGGLALVKVGTTKGYINPQGRFIWKTDRWDEPLRNSVSKPLSTFLPVTTVKALPLSYNWDRVKNAIVFVADGDLDEVRAWYKKRCSGKLKLTDDTDFECEPDKLSMRISRPDAGFCEAYVMAGTADKDTVEAFVKFYSCDNMNELRNQYPTKHIGILIEN